jgi:hypothetical protein
VAQKLISSLQKTIEQKTGLTTGIDSTSDSSFLPTLGSLALSIEMYFQGVTYKGYFEDFQVTEGVSNGVGVFTYDMTFIAMDRSGKRSNFMPWHRSPSQNPSNSDQPVGYNVADSKNTPFSYRGQYNK